MPSLATLASPSLPTVEAKRPCRRHREIPMRWTRGTQGERRRPGGSGREALAEREAGGAGIGGRRQDQKTRGRSCSTATIRRSAGAFEFTGKDGKGPHPSKRSPWQNLGAASS